MTYAKRTAVDTYDWIFACHNTSTNNTGVVYSGNADEVIFTAGPAVGLAVAATDNVKHFLGMVANGTSGKTILDSTVLTSQDTGTDTWEAGSFAVYLGNRTDNSSTPSMVFYEGGVNSTGISDGNWTSLNSQAAAYWA